MTRQEYIAQLTAQLYDLPAEEREAAVEYWDGYIADAGEENEEQVLRELGSPQQLADNIKLETESAGGEAAAHRQHTPAGYGEAGRVGGLPRKKLSGGMLAALIITFPFWITALAVVGSLLFASAAVVAALAVALCAAAVGLFIGGVCGVGLSIVTLATAPLEGLLGFGAALVCLGLGFCFLAGGVEFCAKGIPVFWRGLCWLFRSVFQRGGAER